MYYLVLCTDKPGKLSVREKVRPAHRKYLREDHGVRMLQGGPTLDSNFAMNGTALVVEADDRDRVVEFLANDPYSKAQIFAKTEIRPWRMVEITQGEDI